MHLDRKQPLKTIFAAGPPGERHGWMRVAGRRTLKAGLAHSRHTLTHSHLLLDHTQTYTHKVCTEKRTFSVSPLENDNSSAAVALKSWSAGGVCGVKATRKRRCEYSLAGGVNRTNTPICTKAPSHTQPRQTHLLPPWHRRFP